ncbi:MAG: tRNA (adenosine(37)-N6)-dimethylallyltransferase MiaA [Patescibacteria group bacterium]|nr:tRNA (adenosine(37)-N6)-dimethylallyltransferase MiaA [Patescibacteria group bacterium]
MSVKIKRGTAKPISKKPLPRVIVMVGPTSSGKTSLSLRIARDHVGEIVNADARQMYKGFSIGTGKPPGRRGKFKEHGAFMVQVEFKEDLEKAEDSKYDIDAVYPEIPHYLMDFLEPGEIMSVAEWRESAVRAIRGVFKRGHLPIVVGGTGLYTTALIDNFDIPKVPPSSSLRSSFEKQSLEKLVEHLLRLDPTAANAVDLKNPRRVIRAIEIVTFTGKPISEQRKKRPPIIDAFQVGIKWSREELYKRIDLAVSRMMDEGWPEEVRQQHKAGVSWTAPAMTSIGYREIGMYLRGEIMLDEAVRLIKLSTYHYAKRQETWFKRDPRIHWARNQDEAAELVDAWLAK